MKLLYPVLAVDFVTWAGKTRQTLIEVSLATCVAVGLGRCTDVVSVEALAAAE